MERRCEACGGPMEETEPIESDLWFGELPELDPVYFCPTCRSLEAE